MDQSFWVFIWKTLGTWYCCSRASRYIYCIFHPISPARPRLFCNNQTSSHFTASLDHFSDTELEHTISDQSRSRTMQSIDISSFLTTMCPDEKRHKSQIFKPGTSFMMPSEDMSGDSPWMALSQLLTKYLRDLKNPVPEAFYSSTSSECQEIPTMLQFKGQCIGKLRHRITDVALSGFHVDFYPTLQENLTEEDMTDKEPSVTRFVESGEMNEHCTNPRADALSLLFSYGPQNTVAHPGNERMKQKD